MDHLTDTAEIRSLSDLSNSDGAAMTFDRVIRLIQNASESIVIHMFVWRNDEIGNQIGREILAAADRGVKIHIKKDVGAFMYERIEMNRKSFLT
jgi:phosphatidylserine/phosphatidylglycerophosphate/cardiolipin synthase-like enzyme